MPRILGITRVDTFFVEVQEDDGTYSDYRKCGGEWEKRYGESWEPEYHDDRTNVLNTACQMFWDAGNKF